MRQVFLAIFTLIAVNAFAGTNIQYQAHAPAGTEINSKFSIYIADSTFDETSHLNTSALWYRENVDVEVNNGIINYLIENVSDNVLIDNYGKKLFVYAYVNGVSLGRLQIRSVPYSLLSTYSLEAAEAKVAETANKAKVSDSSRISAHSLSANSSLTSVYSDSARVSNRSNTSAFADTARSAGKATLSDLATYASTAAHSAKSDTSVFSRDAAHAFDSDTSAFAYDANHADFASTSAFATNSARSVVSDTAKFLIDSTVTSRNVQRGAIQLHALEGGESAAVGAYATKSSNGLAWEINPHHRTTSVSIHTIAPLSLSNNSRWIVSRVAVNYNITNISNPIYGQIITVFNGSTANTVTIRNSDWTIDTGLDYTVWPNESVTLWYSGASWVVIQ